MKEQEAREQLAALSERLAPYLAASPLLRGRAHSWPESRWQESFAYGPRVWIKRDDELSFGMSGSKWRKMVSLSQVLEQRRVKKLVAWGSCRSQLILSLGQMAAELGIAVELFLLRSHPWQPRGTDQLHALFAGRAKVHWVEREGWEGVSERARALAAQTGAFLVSEGAVQIEALPGAMSLGLDIASQERRLGLHLAQIAVDAGSGFTAQALICSLAYLHHQATVHVTLCAGAAQTFAAGLETTRQLCAALWGEAPERDAFPPFVLHEAVSARSYGATNASVWREIRERALDSGLILDPIYTAKLSARFRTLPLPSEGESLLVHSGGGLNVFGFDRPWADVSESD